MKKEYTLKDYLKISDKDMFNYISKKAKNNLNVSIKVHETLFNTFACLEPVLNEFSFDKLFQVKDQKAGKDENRFVSFCPVGKKEDSGKVRLTKEFFTTEMGQVVSNQNRIALSEIISDLVKWQVKFNEQGSDINVNLGIMPGWISKEKKLYLMCMDLDNKDFMSGRINEVVSKLLVSFGIDSTFMSNTPSGGKHLFFYSTKEESNSPLFRFVDIRAKTYWIAPGSTTEKGKYVLDLDNKNYSSSIATLPENWREIASCLLNRMFGNQEGSSDSSLSPSSIALTPSMSFENKDTSTKVKFSKNDILKEGTRSNHLVSIAGGLVWSCSSQQDLENKLLEIRNTRMENKDSFSIKEVENIAKWIWSKHTETTPSPPSFSIALTNSSTGIETQGQYTKELISKLSSFRKEETHEVKIESISKIIQSYFEKKFGREYSKPILTKAVGQILRAAGFTKKLRRNGKDRTNFWNISVLSIVSLMTWVDSIHLVQTRNEKHEQTIKTKKQETNTKEMVSKQDYTTKRDRTGRSVEKSIISTRRFNAIRRSSSTTSFARICRNISRCENKTSKSRTDSKRNRPPTCKRGNLGVTTDILQDSFKSLPVHSFKSNASLCY